MESKKTKEIAETISKERQEADNDLPDEQQRVACES